ncbi:MAG: SGNH/GDSL hydrolase family protein [Planctomycetota bacterium]|nr:SGNH/GDSL hydrolase family protein [Planctomycetota bacterium]
MKVRRLFALLGGLLLAVAALELGLRFALPEYRFTDKNSERYWLLRLEEKAAEGNAMERGGMRYDAVLGWRPLAGLARSDYSTNSRGLRGKAEHSYRRASERRRLLFVGDSFTFGYGVLDGEVFGEVFARGHPQVEVINLSANGYGNDQQMLYYREEGARYQADVVVLVSFIPDFHRNVLSVRDFPKPRLRVEGGSLRGGGEPVASVADTLESWRANHGPGLRVWELIEAARKKWLPVPEEITSGERATLVQAILEAWHRDVLRGGGRPVLVLVPHMLGRAWPGHGKMEACYERAAASLGIPCLNLTAEFHPETAGKGDEPTYDLQNYHWTARGHEVAAEKIAAFLAAEGLLGPTGGQGASLEQGLQQVIEAEGGGD